MFLPSNAVVDESLGQASISGASLELIATSKLLAVLVRNRGHARSKEQLLNDVCEYDFDAHLVGTGPSVAPGPRPAAAE